MSQLETTPSLKIKQKFMAICDNAVIHGKSEIGGDVFIADSAEICGGAKI